MTDDTRTEQRIARKERRQQRRRETILDAALKLLTEEGAAGFTIRAVAKASDLSKPAVHYYFSSKEALGSALAVRLVEAEADALVAAIKPTRTALDALTAMVREKARRFTADPETFRAQYLMMSGMGRPSAATLRSIYAASERVNGLVETRLRAGVAAGELAPETPARELVNVAWFGVQGILVSASALYAVGGGLRFPVDQLVATLCETLRRGWTRPRS